jgi:hypothetical protein
LFGRIADPFAQGPWCRVLGNVRPVPFQGKPGLFDVT